MKRLRNRKFTNHKKKMIYYSLFGLLLLISIGYAYLQASLSINGNTTIAANTWDIHFENLSITNGSVAASTPAAINGNSTSISYTVLLSKPGDYYEFSVDTVNAGTISAKVSLVNLQGITSAAEPYLETSYKYESGLPIAVGDLLNPGARKRIVVRVTYKENLNSLPDTDIPLNLTYTINYTQTNEIENNASNLLQNLKEAGNTCIEKYEGDVTDQVGQTVTASNVYFDKCADKINIIFGGFCWKVIRTTETGGLKVIYNGEPVDGKCESTRGDHKGVVQQRASYNISMNSNYLYGSSFTYDINTNEFTLLNTSTATWSDSTYEDLLGKFTCKTTSGTCTTLYKMDYYRSNSNAVVSYFTIDNTNYAQIGKSSFNSAAPSPATAGYMYKKDYLSLEKYNNFNGIYKFGSTFTYNSSTNTYSLSGTTQNISDWTNEQSLLDYTHYTCWNDVGTCEKISYVYHTESSNDNSNRADYINLTGGKNITEALNEMLWDEDVNKRNSTIKDIIDIWYIQNMTNNTNMLEDVVYCNARDVSTIGGWDPNGGDTDGYNPAPTGIEFFSYNQPKDLTCSVLTDQFAVSNNKAILSFPVGLLRKEEWYKHYYTLLKSGADYWTSSPSLFTYLSSVDIGDVESSGYGASSGADNIKGVRPVVSLAPFVIFSSGTGSETDPWVVE